MNISTEYDSLDVRFDDGHIEVGLFAGEHCKAIITLTPAEALILRRTLTDALRDQLQHNRESTKE